MSMWIVFYLGWNEVLVGCVVFWKFYCCIANREGVKVVWQSLNSASSKLRLRGSDQHAPQVRHHFAPDETVEGREKEEKGLSRVDFLCRCRFRSKDAGNPSKLPRVAATGQKGHYHLTRPTPISRVRDILNYLMTIMIWNDSEWLRMT